MKKTIILKMMTLKEAVKRSEKKNASAYTLLKMTRTVSLVKSKMSEPQAEPQPKKSNLSTHFMNAVIRKKDAAR